MNPNPHVAVRPLIASMLLVGSAATLAAQGLDELEREPIRYSATAPNDAVQRLEARLRSGDLRLEGDDLAVLRALLASLDVPVESQVLVFSKTSFQRQRISPSTPRAVYFSDEVYVGWVPGGSIEVAAVDPALGPVFYVLDPRVAAEVGKGRFSRDEDCLSCHGGQFVRGIPAVFVRSVHVDESGEPLLRFGSELVDFRTPFERRWGGWYVTGRHGSALHRGNVLSREEKGELVVDLARGANVTDLGERFSTSRYLARTSDLAALLVLEHQLEVHNAITRAGYQCRRLMHYQQGVQREMGEPVTDEPTYDSVRRVFDGAAQDVVDRLLSKDEAPLPAGGVQGDGAFERAFAAKARRDGAGDSLRDLDLATRVFRNRCSYLIDSEHFAALPAHLRSRIYSRLERALRAEDPDPRYAYLGAEERVRVSAILRETHRGLPAGWGAPAAAPSETSGP